MFRAAYGQFKRFLNWLNGSGRGGHSIADVEKHRNDVRSRYGRGGEWD